MRNHKYQHRNNPVHSKKGWQPRSTNRSWTWKLMALLFCLTLMIVFVTEVYPIKMLGVAP